MLHGEACCVALSSSHSPLAIEVSVGYPFPILTCCGGFHAVCHAVMSRGHTYESLLVVVHGAVEVVKPPQGTIVLGRRRSSHLAADATGVAPAAQRPLDHKKAVVVLGVGAVLGCYGYVKACRDDSDVATYQRHALRFCDYSCCGLSSVVVCCAVA